MSTEGARLGMDVLEEYFDELLSDGESAPATSTPAAAASTRVAAPEAEPAPAIDIAQDASPDREAEDTSAEVDAAAERESAAAIEAEADATPDTAPDAEPGPDHPPAAYALPEVPGVGDLYRAFPVNGFRVLFAEEEVLEVIDRGDATSSDADSVLVPGESETRRLLVMSTVLGVAGSVDSGDYLLIPKSHALAIQLPASGEGVRIASAAVTWRGEGGSRPWLGGTMREERSVFIDLDGLYGMSAG